jgi:hypothetical protein
MIAMSTTPNLTPVKPALDKLQAIERELISFTRFGNDSVNAGSTPIENQKESGRQGANWRASAANRGDHIAQERRRPSVINQGGVAVK